MNYADFKTSSNPEILLLDDTNQITNPKMTLGFYFKINTYLNLPFQIKYVFIAHAIR